MQEKKYPIKEWAIDDRPREKLLRKSPMALSDAELLAILVREGSRDRSAVDLAREVLQLGHNNLSELGKLSHHDLMQIKGIGEAKAVILQAALELGRRRQAPPPDNKMVVTSSRDVAGYFQARFADAQQEMFAALFLNRANHVNHFSIISTGGYTSTIVDLRLLLKKALEVNAVSMILCHNHPSGNLQPSTADKAITARIREGAKLLDIQLLDHVIVSERGYFSFADNGIL